MDVYDVKKEKKMGNLEYWETPYDGGRKLLLDSMAIGAQYMLGNAVAPGGILAEDGKTVIPKGPRFP